MSDARNLLNRKTPPQKPSEAPTEASVERITEEHVAADFANLLAPLIDPAKLDTLKGKRAATPRLRKACYWLQMAHIWGFDVGEVIDRVHSVKQAHTSLRELRRNVSPLSVIE